jgi:hypothetical protein
MRLLIYEKQDARVEKLNEALIKKDNNSAKRKI